MCRNRHETGNGQSRRHQADGRRSHSLAAHPSQAIIQIPALLVRRRQIGALGAPGYDSRRPAALLRPAALRLSSGRTRGLHHALNQFGERADFHFVHDARPARVGSVMSIIEAIQPVCQKIPVPLDDVMKNFK